MCSHKSDIHHTTNKDDHSNYPIVIPAYIENIATIFYIVCRWERAFQLCMIIPYCAFHLFHPTVQWTCGPRMFLHKCIK